MTTTQGQTMENNGNTGTLSRAVEQARSGLHSAIDKASGAARPAVDQLSEPAHQTADTLAGAVTQAEQTLRARSGQLKDAPARLAESCRGQVRDRPLAALGLALVAGIALSWAVLR
jgi:hypothetical protein